MKKDTHKYNTFIYDIKIKKENEKIIVKLVCPFYGKKMTSQFIFNNNDEVYTFFSKWVDFKLPQNLKEMRHELLGLSVNVNLTPNKDFNQFVANITPIKNVYFPQGEYQHKGKMFYTGRIFNCSTCFISPDRKESSPYCFNGWTQTIRLTCSMLINNSFKNFEVIEFDSEDKFLAWLYKIGTAVSLDRKIPLEILKDLITGAQFYASIKTGKNNSLKIDEIHPGV